MVKIFIKITIFILVIVSHSVFSESKTSSISEIEETKEIELIEQNLDNQIKEIFLDFSKFNFLVKKAQSDQLLKNKQEKTDNTNLLEIKYIPGQTSVRYVKLSEEQILKPFINGNIEELKQILKNEISESNSKTGTNFNLNFGNWEGIEIGYFDIINRNFDDKVKNVGSHRRWLNLYFDKNKIVFSTLRIDYVNFKTGEKTVDLIIDSTPSESKHELLLISRINSNKSKVLTVSSMDNTKFYPNRNLYKRYYIDFLLNEFFPLLQKVSINNNPKSSELQLKAASRMARNLQNSEND